MILVDSSAWIAHLKGREDGVAGKLQAVMSTSSHLILVGDLILLEILQGARDDREARALQDWLTAFQVVTLLDDGVLLEAARNYRSLRARGITVRSTIDMIAGAFCIQHCHQLLHDDRDFHPMEQHLGLKVL